uniref:Ubiquitin carboxyl-terminal hydrolase 14 n=1 Tax=Ditylenchus dipsaci TaxID=166011 RepID=A0A915CQN4_9BILA
MPRIFVKWQSKKLEVDVNTDLEPMILKCQLFDLTGVAPERQKIIIKGNLLKDDDWGNITLEEGLVCMMLGASSVSTEGQSKEARKLIRKLTGRLPLPCLAFPKSDSAIHLIDLRFSDQNTPLQPER